LYADALCMNQADMDERSSQVQLMADIYRNAQPVVIWLGQDGSGSAGLAMKWIKDYADYAAREWSKTDSSPDSVRFKDFGTQRSDTKTVEAISDLLHCPWFRRVWLLQEAALAKRTTIISRSVSLPLRDSDHLRRRRTTKRVRRIRRPNKRRLHLKLLIADLGTLRDQRDMDGQTAF
jgi:hypothetical protein